MEYLSYKGGYHIHGYIYIYIPRFSKEELAWASNKWLWLITVTIFIRIEARAFISYKQLLTRHLYDPFPHFI